MTEARIQVWFSNRRARLRKQLASSSSSYAPLGVVGNPYSAPATPYAIGQVVGEGSFGSSTSATGGQIAELYPSHGHGHSSSPNLPVTSHNLGHNPWRDQSHAIYPSNLTNIMPLGHNMSPTPTSLGPNIAPSGTPPATMSSVQDMSQHNYKTETENNINSTSPGVQMYPTNLPPTPNSMVTILGPNSGEFFINFFIYTIVSYFINFIFIYLQFFSIYLFICLMIHLLLIQLFVLIKII